MKINKKLLSIKAHFFFFMAAMGPILPQLSVYGKELGISPVVMGSVTGILPIAFLIAKPLFGMVVDVMRNYRKFIFISLIIATSLFYALLALVPARFTIPYDFKNVTGLQLDTCNVTDYQDAHDCKETRRIICRLATENSSTIVFHALAKPSKSFDKECDICLESVLFNFTNGTYDFECEDDLDSNTHCLYSSVTFWGFVILMSLGTIGFNVLNSITDAICFDIVGEEGDYGKQRVWGTYGFGITALISGYLVDYLCGRQLSYIPAFIIMSIFTVFDVLSCIKLELPIIEAPKNIFKDLRRLVNNKHTITFIFYATMAGVVDSFIIYFLFWYLEDLALQTNTTNIKLLEGLTVAAETLGAEVIFFYLSGSIIERFGYAHSFSMCFICYGLRFGLISVIPNPWWVVPIEFVLQGPTYALIYTTIVAYANAISPPGMSATVQGIAAGMDDGFGYSVGSIIGGLLYKYFGGKAALQVFSALSVTCGISHLVLHKTLLQRTEISGTVPRDEYLSPKEALVVIEKHQDVVDR